MENDTSIWNKKQDDLTVADNLKIAGGVMVISMIAPLLVLGAVGAGAAAYTKLQERRQAKKAAKKN
jgi:hypothetical protein